MTHFLGETNLISGFTWKIAHIVQAVQMNICPIADQVIGGQAGLITSAPGK